MGQGIYTFSMRDKAFTLFQCLKKFYDLTELLSGTSYPTANLFYKGFCDIKLMVDDWCFSDDETIRTVVVAMNEKFQKYWQRSNIALAVASFLDPRYKKKLIEYHMRKFYGDEYQVELDEFVSVIKKLYQFYASSPNATSKFVAIGRAMKAATPRRGGRCACWCGGVVAGVNLVCAKMSPASLAMCRPSTSFCRVPPLTQPSNTATTQHTCRFGWRHARSAASWGSVVAEEGYVSYLSQAVWMAAPTQTTSSSFGWR